ncbi:MAG: HYR domain-containing protein [Saprospirales bacterium]|nr:HYR domain-containing protein [Saprospirales bacterium]
MTELNRFPVTAVGITSPICAPINLNRQVRFYTDATKSTLYATVINPTVPVSTASQLFFDCQHAGQTRSIWVAINDGTLPFDPLTESEAIPLVVNIKDITLPMALTNVLAPVTVNTSWALPFPPFPPGPDPACKISRIYFTQLFGGGIVTPVDIAIYGINGAPTIPNEFFDNCLDSLRITWQLSGATNRPETNAAGSHIEIVPQLYYDAGQDTFNLGTTTVTYRIYDKLANPSGSSPLVFTVNVTVVDDTDPLITCPANIAVSNDAGLCSAVVNFAATATDNCNTVNVTYTQNPGTAFPVGAPTNVTATATDGAANTSTCMFSVTVNDTEKPKIPALTVPADITIGTSTGAGTMPPPNSALCDGLYAWMHPNATDNCPGVLLEMSVGGGPYAAVAPNGMQPNTIFPLGSTTVVYRATDAVMNSTSTQFTVTVEDNEPPIIASTLVTSYSVAVTPGDCSKAITFDRPNFLNTEANDCGTVIWTQGIARVNGVPNPGFLTGIPAYTPFDIFGLLPATTTFPTGTTVIPYYFTDPENNVDSILITFFVDENIPPVAKCKAGTITLPLDATGSATLTTAMVDDGSNDNCSSVTLSLSQMAFGCAGLPGTHIVTLTVTDAATHTATCTATIDVVDNIAPQILCPGNKTVTTNMGCTAVNIADIGVIADPNGLPLSAGQYLDNCGVTAVNWQLSGVTSGSGMGSLPLATAFNKGVTTVTYTVADLQGNNQVCNFTVNVVDNTPPAWNGNGPAAGSSIVVNANLGGCQAQVSWTEPTFTDACTPPVVVTRFPAPGFFFPFDTTVVTYTAIDGVGNATTHTFNVVVVDIQDPVANCKNLTVNLDGISGQATVSAPQVNNNSTDNCFFNFVSSSITYDCTDLGNGNTYEMIIEDGSGNRDTCYAAITVQDLIKPVPQQNLVSPINLDANGSFTLFATTVNNNSTDNTYPQCALTYDISVGGSSFSPAFDFDCSFLGPQTVTFRVTDAAGNTATLTQNVLVKDITPPTFTPPANITINCDDSTDPDDTGTYSNVSDNCDADPDVVQLPDAFIPGGCINSFTIIRSWRATDASNNSAVVSHTIFVQDVEDPVFDIQSAIVIQTEDPNYCDAPLVMQLTQDSVSDNCTTDFGDLDIFYMVDYPTPDYGYVDVMIPMAGSAIPINFFPIGTSVITWTVYDECGNSATKSVTVTVEDTQGPIFTNGYQSNCGQAYVLPNTSGACSNLFTWARPSVFFGHVGDCLDFTVTESFDGTGQTSISTVLALTNPFNYYNSLSFQVFPTAQFPVGITTVIYTATDAAGNSSVCSFTVEVEDTQAPALTCPPNQVLAATCPTAQIPNYTNLVQVSDNCSGNVDMSQSIAPGTTLGAIFAPNPPTAGNQFTIVVTGDDGYNTSTCSFTVTLQDGQAPIPTVATLPALIDSCGTLIVLAPTAIDPCNPNASIIYATPSTPVGTFLNTNPPSYQLNPGNYVLTWVYNDGNGNISTQPQNITVLVDIFPPVAICVPNLTVNLDPSTGTAPVAPGQLNNGSYDPNDCGPLSFSVNPATLTCANAGPSPTVVTLTVRDLKNNPATCTTSITVKDITSPVFTGVPNNITIEACDTIPAAVKLTATDACGGTSMISATPVSTQDPTGGFLKYNYTITRTWSVTDPSGNSAVATRTVTVKDTKKPVFSGAPTMVMVSTDPNRMTCDDTVNINILPFVTDCATGPDLSVTNNKEPGDGANLSAIFSVGTHTVIFTATDISGNSATYSLTVVVKDATPPTAVCINGVSAALQPSGTVVVNTAQFNNNSSDNCPGNLDLKIQRLDVNPLQTPSNTLTYDCDDADGVTQHPVKLFVMDQAGNKSMCETYIVIQDNVDPTITLCPAGKTVVCTDPLSTQTHGAALATDNCPDNLTIGFEDLLDEDTTGQSCYLVRRIWVAEDLAGNTATCEQTFRVLDTIAPALSQYPLDVTISCSEDLAAPLNITASDNCSDSLAVTFVQDTVDIAPGLCGKYSYTITRTRTVADDCGNEETHTNSITVLDDEGPKFPGMPDTLTVLSANFTGNNNCLVPVTLNVAQYIVDCAPVSELLVLNDAPHGNDSLDASGNYEVGNYMVHFSATDPCGNPGVDSVVIIVIDNSKPTAICNNNVVISLGSDGSATIEAEDINLGSSDNCGIDTMYLDVATFDCADLGVQPITLTVVDPYGNSNTCTVNVEVTLGNGAGFTLVTTGSPETYFGADNGSATTLASGGSGNFAYIWNTGATTTTVNGLSAGIYTVMVTDTVTGCVQKDTAIVQAGAKLTVTAGTASGTQGQTIQVPVTVDNFNAMVGLSFSLNVTNNAVGAVTGSANPNASLPGLGLNVVGSSLTVFWANATPVTLPNGSVLFNLVVQLGAAPIGSTSPVTITGTPTVLSFQQDSSGSIVPAMANLVNGMVTIDSLAADDIEISGLIKTWAGAGTPVPGVTVELSNGATGSVVTDVPGTYSFSLPYNTSGTISAKKTVTSNFSQGINVGDLLAIQNHAASVTLLTNPYQYVAGDVNNDNKVGLPDYLLVQQLILGTVQHYSNGAPDWKFVPEIYMFPSPNPLSVAFPQTASFACCDDSIMNWRAVRMGDLTGNAPVNNIVGNGSDRSGDAFRFRIDEQSVRAGGLITVPFKAKDFTDRQAYQMTINFDPNVLELADIQPGVLPNLGAANFGTAHLADGHLTTLWVSLDPLTLNEGEVLFTLTFRTRGNSARLSDVLRVGSEITFAEALDENGQSIPVEFYFETALGNVDTGLAAFALYQNQPNPFREETVIGFRLPQAGRAVLRVFGMDGRLVKTVVGNFAQGYNTVALQQGEFGAPGVYWYELETATNSDRKKMILID